MEDTLDFSRSAVAILSINSPFFDALWPVIFELADDETQDILHLTHRYFKSMWDCIDVRRKSDHAKAEYDIITSQNHYPPEARLTCPAPVWYAWGVYKADFNSKDQFKKVYAIAGVDPASGQMVDSENEDKGWVFLSRDRDVTFTIMQHPLADGQGFLGKGYVHQFGCTGERDKALQLEEWWLDGGSCSEVWRGDRSKVPTSSYSKPNYLLYLF
jgi:hypothetical protein